jgi:peptidyl-prolyl cis-trans isomerase C
MERLTYEDLVQIFGEGGAQIVSSAETGDWWEAQQSSRGRHWVRVRERFGSAVPPLDVVRDAVRLDWIAAQEQVRLLDRVAELRINYTVVVEGR